MCVFYETCFFKNAPPPPTPGKDKLQTSRISAVRYVYQLAAIAIRLRSLQDGLCGRQILPFHMPKNVIRQPKKGKQKAYPFVEGIFHYLPIVNIRIDCKQLDSSYSSRIFFTYYIQLSLTEEYYNITVNTIYNTTH